MASPHRSDVTIQKLYWITARIFDHQLKPNENAIDDLVFVCQKTDNMITEALATLQEEVPDVTKWSPPTDTNTNTVSTSDNDNDTTSTSDNNADSHDDTNANDNTTTTRTYNNTSDSSTIDNWTYIEQCISKLDENAPILWQNIYDNGRTRGLFNNYAR
ncbi:hypothetical protein BDB00DRAFT_875505 [Zychaea mexicana]|uniref:uncharacterized protein n=1 Tax=Zychaea mexicana TaxID=64656 RepID=UPI0022FDC2F9|nr:uncharacterized protein BDB00DRAFT_875505 [Zychaea mexicana]KAI9490309.1 hypothetical protein BDB00DRAFT_875505 [Zychaea mexicana]